MVSNIVRINLFKFPEPNLPDTILFCTNFSRITLNGFKSYLWSIGGIDNYINTPTNGTYWVKVKNNNSCVNYDTFLFC
jgi:hypothetical protein